MKKTSYIWISTGLIATSVFFLVLESVAHIEFLLHLAAIPLEILATIFVIEILLEKSRIKERKTQLRHIKSCMFRLEMRDLFISNFQALKTPKITFHEIRNASLLQLKRMRENAETVEYQSLEQMEPVIIKYVDAQQTWRNFMNLALDYNFESIFQDMVYILHFVGNVKNFRDNHPDELFISQAAKNDRLMNKTMKILGDGIRKFLDYAIEMKETDAEVFDEIFTDYELSAKMTLQSKR